MRRTRQPCVFVVLAMSLMMGLIVSDTSIETATTTTTRRGLVDSNSVLMQVGGDIAAPPQGETGIDGELCLMDMTPNGNCIAQAYYATQEGASRVHVFCRDNNATVDSDNSTWVLKGSSESSANKKYCSALAMSDSAHRVAVANEENGAVDIYEYDSNNDNDTGSWKLVAQVNGGEVGYGSTLDMNNAGTRLVVGDSTNKRYFAYELLVAEGAATLTWTQVHMSPSTTDDDYAHVVSIKADGSVFAVSSRDSNGLQVHLVEWDSWTPTSSFPSFSQPSSGGRIVDGTFSGDGTRFVLTVDADMNDNDDDGDLMEIHEISAATHVGLVSYLPLGTATPAAGRTALNDDGTLLALSDPHAEDSKGALWLLRFDVASSLYVTIATLVGFGSETMKEGLGQTVKLSADGLTLATNAMPLSSSSSGEQSPLTGNVKVFDVNVGPAPTMAPTKETFVVNYAGNAIAGFGGDFEGNEVTIPFLVSPRFNKEVSLFLEDCQTEMPTSLMTATHTEEPANNGGNLLKYHVHLALNLPNIGALQTNQEDDSLWKGQNDAASNTLTFCVRVDLMTSEDILMGDELTDKTSVNFKALRLQVEVDFFAEVPAISAVLDGSRGLPPLLVDPEVYGVTGCHCDAVQRTCYDPNNEAPELTPHDTLNVCFSVSAPHVGLAEILSFPVTQGDLSFDPIQAGPNFYTALYEGNVAIFMSRLPSAFFRNVNATIGATATVELYFNETNDNSTRRLETVSSSTTSSEPPPRVVTTTKVVDTRSADVSSSSSSSSAPFSRHLQDITDNPNFGLDIAVEIQVQGVRVSMGGQGGNGGGQHHVIVPASVYGVSACHCQADTLTCYDNNNNNTAPALTQAETLNVCFFVSTRGVSVAQVASFVVMQGMFRFQTLVAGNEFYSEENYGSSAVLRSRLPSVFFSDVTVPLSAMATIELRFVSTSRRALVTTEITAPFTSKNEEDRRRRRRLQDLSYDANLAVVLQVDGVFLSSQGGSASRVTNDDKESSHDGDFWASNHNVVISIVVCLTVLAVLILLCFVFRTSTPKDGEFVPTNIKGTGDVA